MKRMRRDLAGCNFKDDPANPVQDRNMVFIPYVTSGVFANNRPNAIVPVYSQRAKTTDRNVTVTALAEIIHR